MFTDFELLPDDILLGCTTAQPAPSVHILPLTPQNTLVLVALFKRLATRLVAVPDSSSAAQFPNWQPPKRLVSVQIHVTLGCNQKFASDIDRII